MFLQFQNISKSFSGAAALLNVSFAVNRGECLGLMGENGAGKSTLGKLLAGIHRPDDGRIFIDSTPQDFRGPRDALRAGVAMVHQELAFCPDLSVAENLLMGQYPRLGRGPFSGLLSRGAMYRIARRRLDSVGLHIDVRQPMRALSIAQEQLVQIAAAIGADARILIFDEPTSSLSEPESQKLFSLISDLRARGVTLLYISHRMPEVFRICDRITVLRDGRHVGTLKSDELEKPALQDRIVQMMIGRPLEQYFPRHVNQPPARELLRATSLASPEKFRDISFSLRSGEILGLAGLVGSGRSEIARAIFGLDPAASGAISIDGNSLPMGNPRRAMSRGIGLLPEDRKRQGLILTASARQNFSLASLKRFARFGFLNQRKERAQARSLFQRLNVRCDSIDAPVAALSGGNQQKVVLARWLARDCRVLIIDEPTRGVDVGAKAAIHSLIDELAQGGAAILLISSELPELLNLSTRILIIREGRLVGELSRSHATQENLLRLMAGIEPMHPTPAADVEK